MQLPDSLQPWRPWLDWFSPELARELGGMLRQLSAVLGPLRGNRLAGPPEPDGLGDLRNRGPYDRLLGSEWLLADEMPDEFLRRAASGEHLFLSHRPRARPAEQVIVALFDTGPLQLGAPRLAQLALWILLARRAAAAGGELRWGARQAPGPLKEARTAFDLRRLLRARSLDLAGSWSGWQDPLAEATPALREFWHIGSAAPDAVPAGMPQPSHVVTIRRAVETDGLEIGIGEGRRRRTALLALPGAAPGARLLKGSFLDPASPAAHLRVAEAFAITRPPILAPGGSDVAVPLLGRPDFHVFHIPKTRDSDRIKPRLQQLPKGAEPLTVAFHAKTFGALLASPDELQFWRIGLPPVRLPPRETFQAAAGRANWLASAWVKQGRARRFYVLDEAHRLVCWAAGETPETKANEIGKCRLVSTHVIGLAVAGRSAIVYVRQDAGAIELHLGVGARSQTRKLRFPNAAAVAAAHFAGLATHFAGGIDPARQVFGLATVTRDGIHGSEDWTLYRLDPERAHGIEAFSLPPRHIGIGLVQDSTASQYALVVLNPDGRGVTLHRSQEHRELIFTSPAKIMRATVDGASGMIALLTEQRQLIVYSTSDRSLRLFLHSTGGEDDAA